MPSKDGQHFFISLPFSVVHPKVGWRVSYPGTHQKYTYCACYVPSVCVNNGMSGTLAPALSARVEAFGYGYQIVLGMHLTVPSTTPSTRYLPRTTLTSFPVRVPGFWTSISSNGQKVSTKGDQSTPVLEFMIFFWWYNVHIYYSTFFRVLWAWQCAWTKVGSGFYGTQTSEIKRLKSPSGQKNSNISQAFTEPFYIYTTYSITRYVVSVESGWSLS